MADPRNVKLPFEVVLARARAGTLPEPLPATRPADEAAHEAAADAPSRLEFRDVHSSICIK